MLKDEAIHTVGLGYGCMMQTLYKEDTGEVCSVHYFKDRRRHREDGPAVIFYYPDYYGHIEYYLNGRSCTEEQRAEIEYNMQFDEELEEVLEDKYVKEP